MGEGTGGDEYGRCATGDASRDQPNEYFRINVSPTPRWDQLPWRDLIAPTTPLPTPAVPELRGVVGAFLGPETQCRPVDGYYRPELECLMNLETRLCAVCRAAWRRFFAETAERGCTAGWCGTPGS